jgi:hypothetical protein
MAFLCGLIRLSVHIFPAVGDLIAKAYFFGKAFRINSYENASG